ncbi:Ctr copper transporter [Xylaria bambusicola]|uniref:Ctr copper transporter n=1 Tax=Xylaria bambusicola TaxID=326684 RepID=UPI002008A5F0|nr:Ctr copper transporter [Xylaria bambusicola]KAI0522270.1 Ctr copper transporter [Xylaria bambusicola]
MAHSHGDDMDMGSSSSSHSSGGHMSVFNNNLMTALYSDEWTPSTPGAYAGTIIFLIFLAVVFRFLLAGKAVAEARWLDAEMKRRYVVVQGKLPVSEQISRDDLSKRVTLTENGVEENVFVVQRREQIHRPFRLSVDPLRAAFDTVITGVGYLLMLGVMTMNVGYFLAVLGGTFLGSLLVGRIYATAGGEH